MWHHSSFGGEFDGLREVTSGDADLVTQSIRLQARIIHLDQLIYAKTVDVAAEPPSPLAAERERLRAAFGASFGEIAPA